MLAVVGEMAAMAIALANPITGTAATGTSFHVATYLANRAQIQSAHSQSAIHIASTNTQNASAIGTISR